jgi:chromosome segregation ATPase
MDVRLQNAYVEVLLGNFMEVVKQNLMFQAQLEVLKTDTKDVGENQRRLKEISDNNVELQKQLLEKDREISRLTTERNDLKNSSSNNNSLAQEKQRLQSAVNDYMRQLNEAKNEVLRVRSESQDVLLQNNNRIEELTKYISRLEVAVPANKLKKVKLGESIQPETPEVTEIIPSLPLGDESVKNGGTF